MASVASLPKVSIFQRNCLDEVQSRPYEGNLWEVMAETSSSNPPSLFWSIWQLGDTLVILQKLSRLTHLSLADCL